MVSLFRVEGAQSRPVAGQTIFSLCCSPATQLGPGHPDCIAGDSHRPEEVKTGPWRVQWGFTRSGCHLHGLALCQGWADRTDRPGL